MIAKDQNRFGAWVRRNDGQPAWYTRLGQNFVVKVEPASVGFRADLCLVGTLGSIRIGFYSSEDAALDQAVHDARAMLRGASEAATSTDGLVPLPAGAW